MENQEIGGAQALLSLGTKDVKDEDHLENSDVLLDHDNQLNDDVEAAVMRYVGGNLEETHSNATSGQKKRNHDDIMSDYHWDRFLHEEVTAELDLTPPKRRRQKHDDQDIDPDLEDLDLAAEHDQLVRDAIMGANELTTLDIPEKRTPKTSHDSQAVLSRSGGLKPRPLSRKRPTGRGATTTETSHHQLTTKYLANSIDQLVREASGEALLWYGTQVDSGNGGPRLFLSEEKAIMNSFIERYCQLNHLTREDICRRVWLTDRQKDNFWDSVTKVMPYRSRASVYKHMRRLYHVFPSRAKWTKEEDSMLAKLAYENHPNWKQIGEAMNRMPEDCRDRWRNYIKCGENRANNKWSSQEEQTLRNVVMEMLADNVSGTLNWTKVSERMDGIRSRIQCRYKWNKLLQRDSMARIVNMDDETQQWLISRLVELQFDSMDAIDWEYLASLYHDKKSWLALDFRNAFQRMKLTIKDHKNMPLHAILEKFAYSQHGVQLQHKTPRNTFIQAKSSDEQDAASIATATVAAVASDVNDHDAQPQNYSLWR